eukprot:1121862-Pyramimonas_sp.AAC.1
MRRSSWGVASAVRQPTSSPDSTRQNTRRGHRTAVPPRCETVASLRVQSTARQAGTKRRIRTRRGRNRC